MIWFLLEEISRMHDQESSRTVKQAVEIRPASVKKKHEDNTVEERLHDYEQRFRSLFEQAAVGMIQIGHDGLLQRVNRRFCDIFGYSEEELAHLSLQDLSHPDDRSADLAHINAMASGDSESYELEKRYRRKDGSYVWVSLAITPVCDRENAVNYFSIVVQDISKQKALETQLCQAVEGAQERANQMEALIDAMTDHITVYDKVGNLLHLNFLVRDLIVTSPSDYVAQPLATRVSNADMRDENGRLMLESEWPLSRILQGEIIKGAQAIDVIYRKPDGDDFQISVSGAPLRNSERQIIGALCISRDVTERRKLERRTHEALNALVAMASALVQTSPYSGSLDTPSASYLIGKRVVELTRRVLDCKRVGILSIIGNITSPIATVGFSEAEERAWFTDNKDNTPNLMSLLSNPVINARLRTNETLRLDLSQPPFQAIASKLSLHAIMIAPIRADEELIGVLYADRGDNENTYSKDDIALIEAMTQVCALITMRQRDAQELAKAMTTLQEANVQLELLNKLQSNFIAMVGHEFRTTLTSIQGFSELMRDEQFDISEVKEYASDIHTDALRLHRMINDLLDLERMKSGKMTLHLELTDLNAMLLEVTDRTRMVSPHHTIKFLTDQALPRVEGDRDKLIQVVTNLLSNAIKYSSKGGVITVRSFPEGGNAHITVQDEGIGIPLEAHDKVFAPYSRIDSDKTRYVQGTGLGLPIVRQIVDMHGGHVWVDSTLGQGSTFHFVLPFMHVLTTSKA
jgi:PAS domain S-box-containing protein